MVRLKKSALRIPLAPVGPAELPSESKAKLAPPQSAAVPEGADTPKAPVAPPDQPNPLRRQFPFLTSTQLMTLPEADMRDANIVRKIELFYRDTAEYEKIVKKYGEEHKFYRDKKDYGDQEQREDKKRNESGRSSAKAVLKSFYS